MNQICKRSILQILVILLVTCISALIFRADAEANYSRGTEFLRRGNYQQAELYFSKCTRYHDGAEKFNQIQEYLQAKELFDGGQLDEARKIFFRLGDFEKSSEYVEDIDERILNSKNEQTYNEACKYMLQGNYLKAYNLFNTLGSFEDSEVLALECEEKWRQSNAEVLSAGVRSSCGIAPDNTVVFSMGDTFLGRSEIQEWNDIVSVSTCGEIVAGLKQDGTVVTAVKQEADQYDRSIDTSGWKSIIAVSTGDRYVIGLRNDGHVLVESLLTPDGYGETDISDWNDITAIDTAWQLTVGLDQAGNVHVSGYCAEELQKEIEDKSTQWVDIVSVSVGGSGDRFRGKGHIVGLTKDGRVVAVGDNDYGQCDVSDWAEEHIVAISAGDYHTVALTEDGRVLTTQKEECHFDGVDFTDSVEQIAKWRNIVAVSAGYGFTLGLKSDGTVVSAGNKNDGQASVKGWELLRE